MNGRMIFAFGSVSVISLAAGATAGYLVAKKQLEDEYARVAEEEIAQAKKYYKSLHKKEEYRTPEDAVKALIPDKVLKAVQEYQGAEKIEDVQEEIARNVFENARPEEPDMNLEEEIQNRDHTQPYIITVEEHLENDHEHDQITLTYFEGDDVLVDERDRPIDHDKVDATVGLDNLCKFGHRSGDRNIVYVRNDKLRLDFEILHSDGKFSKEVLGFDDDNRVKPRRRRGDDE